MLWTVTTITFLAIIGVSAGFALCLRSQRSGHRGTIVAVPEAGGGGGRQNRIRGKTERRKSAAPWFRSASTCRRIQEKNRPRGSS